MKLHWRRDWERWIAPVGICLSRCEAENCNGTILTIGRDTTVELSARDLRLLRSRIDRRLKAMSEARTPPV
jgi:hypothetical protein